MPDPERFPFTAGDGGAGEAGLLPYLPVVLVYQGRSVEASGLLDTGATVNVMPYHTGAEIGAVWEEGSASLKLTGNLAQYEAQPLVVEASIGSFSLVRLAFAWTRAEEVPLILGQVNFFMEYDVCFYRARRYFEVQPKR